MRTYTRPHTVRHVFKCRRALLIDTHTHAHTPPCGCFGRGSLSMGLSPLAFRPTSVPTALLPTLIHSFTMLHHSLSTIGPAPCEDGACMQDACAVAHNATTHVDGRKAYSWRRSFPSTQVVICLRFYWAVACLLHLLGLDLHAMCQLLHANQHLLTGVATP